MFVSNMIELFHDLADSRVSLELPVCIEEHDIIDIDIGSEFEILIQLLVTHVVEEVLLERDLEAYLVTSMVFLQIDDVGVLLLHLLLYEELHVLRCPTNGKFCDVESIIRADVLAVERELLLLIGYVTNIASVPGCEFLE
jgi:hypothetical protein